MMMRGPGDGGVAARALAALVVCCAACGWAGGVARGDITLRTGERIVEPIEVISIEGIVVRGATTRLIGWESIERVGGARRADAAHFMPMAERAWRARIRLERGDLSLAEPLLEELFAELRGRDGSVALLAAEGLMRCRLSRAEVAGAVVPWLEAVRLRDRGAMVRGEEPGAALLESSLLLTPALPPFFTAEQAGDVLDRLRDEGEGLASSGASAELRRWYRRAAEHDAGRGGSGVGERSGGESSQHPGARFVADLVLARTAGQPADRAFHRNRLRLGLEQDIDTWREAWRRAGLGMSYLAEGDDQNTLLGVLELLHLPARFGTTQPQLAGLALAHASAALERLGYGESADRLRDELRVNFAGHPALRMISEDAGAGRDGSEESDPLEGDAALEVGEESVVR